MRFCVKVESHVLWLATSIVHAANARRPNTSGVKVGGHQSSSASMVSVMTTLWFDALTAADKVSVKPHASPVLHAINYLLGRLDLPSRRDLRGHQLDRGQPPTDLINLRERKRDQPEDQHDITVRAPQQPH